MSWRGLAAGLLLSVVLWLGLGLLARLALADPVGVSLGTSPQLLVPNPGRPWRLISVSNEATTGNVAVCFGYNPPTSLTPCTPVVNGAGSYTLVPGVIRIWAASDVLFFGPVYGVASAPSTPITVNFQ
jgi:hypothetical protein